METLDFVFPIFVFVYGSIMVMVTHSRKLEQLAHKRLDSAFVERFYSHRLLGRICFFVGFFWTLQRIYMG